MVTQDDEYNGYFIPAGTLVVGNTWYAHPIPSLCANNLTGNSGQFFMTQKRSLNQRASIPIVSWTPASTDSNSLPWTPSPQHSATDAGFVPDAIWPRPKFGSLLRACLASFTLVLESRE